MMVEIGLGGGISVYLHIFIWACFQNCFPCTEAEKSYHFMDAYFLITNVLLFKYGKQFKDNN